MKFPIEQLNAILDRYPGLEELIEEFEHLALAWEDQDTPAISYFQKQQELRRTKNDTTNLVQDTRAARSIDHHT
jgi:hypothetical protein